MKVRLLFFAGLREQLGVGGEEIELPVDVSTVAALRTHLAQRGPQWRAAFADPKRVRAAVNQNMAASDTPLATGDEIAFFPPVTGG